MSIIEREQEQVLVDPVREGRARVLEAAALEIEVRGWATGPTSARHWDGGPVCLVGGITAAMGAPPFGARGKVADYALASEVWAGTPTLCHLLWRFNDARGRDPQDVTFVLRWRAAEIRDGR